MSAAAKVKKEKPGKVIRIDPTLYRHIEKKKRSRETWSSVLRRELGLQPKRGIAEFSVFFALPSDLHKNAAEARGYAITRAVRSKSPPEKPVKLRPFE